MKKYLLLIVLLINVYADCDFENEFYFQGECVQKQSCLFDKIQKLQITPRGGKSNFRGKLRLGLLYEASLLDEVDGYRYQVLIKYTEDQKTQLLDITKDCLNFKIYQINKGNNIGTYVRSEEQSNLEQHYSNDDNLTTISFSVKQKYVQENCELNGSQGQKTWNCNFELAFEFHGMTLFSSYLELLIQQAANFLTSPLVRIIELEVQSRLAILAEPCEDEQENNLMFCADTKCQKTSQSTFGYFFVNRQFIVKQQIRNSNLLIEDPEVELRGKDFKLVLNQGQFKVIQRDFGFNIYIIGVPLPISDLVIQIQARTNQKKIVSQIPQCESQSQIVDLTSRQQPEIEQNDQQVVDTDETYITEEAVSEEAVQEEVLEEALLETAVSEEVVSEQVVSEEAVSEEAVSEEAVREETISEEAVSEEAVSEEAVSEITVSEEAVSEETVSEEAVSQEVVSEEAVSEEAVSQEAVSDETVSEEAVSQEEQSYEVVQEEAELVLPEETETEESQIVPSGDLSVREDQISDVSPAESSEEVNLEEVSSEEEIIVQLPIIQEGQTTPPLNSECDLKTHFVYFGVCTEQSCIFGKLSRVQFLPSKTFTDNAEGKIMYKIQALDLNENLKYQVTIRYGDLANNQILSDPQKCIDYRVYQTKNQQKIDPTRLNLQAGSNQVPTWPVSTYKFNDVVEAGEVTFLMTQQDLTDRKCLSFSEGDKYQWKCYFEFAFILGDQTQSSFYFNVVIFVEKTTTATKVVSIQAIPN